MKQLRLQTNERGMASMVVTMILMVVITLVVIAFASSIRREQRSALDDQLSSQAYYAAESGVNDTQSYVEHLLSIGQPIPEKTTCGNDSNYTVHNVGTIPSTIDSSTSSSYTCILVTGNPKSLQYTLSSSSPSTAFPIDASQSGGTPSSVLFEWKLPASTTASGCTSSVSAALPAPSAWNCSYGMLRVDLVPLNTLSRSAFAANTMTSYFEPTRPSSGTGEPTPTNISYATGSNINGGSANQGALSGATCNATECATKVILPSGLGQVYYARVSILYRDTQQLTIEALDNTGSPLSLSDAQIMIDSTGKASDVLRRVQVRVPLTYNGTYADYGLESTNSICKSFSTFKTPAGSPKSFSTEQNQSSGC